MKDLFKNALRIQIESKYGSDFEDFIHDLFLLRYGSNDFIPIRGEKDKGNDGTIKSEKKIIACYAPKKYDFNKFKQKVIGSHSIKGDYAKYEDNWKDNYPNWEILVNHDISPDQLNLIENLEGNTSIVGLKQILAIIENDLSSNQRRNLAESLDISSMYEQDYLEDVIKDLLSQAKNPSLVKYSKDLVPPYDKITLNFSVEDRDGINSEMKLVMQYFGVISNILSHYSDQENNLIKHQVISDFNELDGNFKTKLRNLTFHYVKNYSKEGDTEYSQYTRCVLLYMFDLCLIGKK